MTSFIAKLPTPSPSSSSYTNQPPETYTSKPRLFGFAGPTKCGLSPNVAILQPNRPLIRRAPPARSRRSGRGDVCGKLRGSTVFGKDGSSFSIRDEGRADKAPAGFRPAAPRRRNGAAGIFEQARSSGGEHYLDTVGVSGSNPLEPTNLLGRRRLAQLEERYLHTVEVNGSIPLAPTRDKPDAGRPASFVF